VNTIMHLRIDNVVIARTFASLLLAFIPALAVAQVVYIDADVTSNTTLADGSPLVAGTHYFVTPTSAAGDTRNDGLWDIRPFANQNSIISSNNTGAENAPALRTTISGLPPGQGVALYAYLWGSTNANWRLRASLTPPNEDGTADGEVLRGFNSNHFSGSAFEGAAFVTRHVNSGINPGPLSTESGADPAFESGGYFANTSPVMTGEGNRALYQANLGNVLVDHTGQVHVYIDDLAGGGAGGRTWYDGVGYELVDLDILTLEVNTLTGTVAIRNNDNVSLDLRYYEIRSSAGSLVFDASYESGWSPLDSDPDPAAVTIPGWQVAGGSDAHILSETNFGGSLTLAPAESAGLGTAFAVAGQHDLEFYYVPVGATELTRGFVDYVTAIRGDFNGDNRVDAADYTLWRDNLGASTEDAFAPGTGSGNGVVDLADYTLWRSSFGIAVPPASLQNTLAAVPEPSSLALAIALPLGLACSRRMVARLRAAEQS
jgi:hypothetical protein